MDEGILRFGIELHPSSDHRVESVMLIDQVMRPPVNRIALGIVRPATAAVTLLCLLAALLQPSLVHSQTGGTTSSSGSLPNETNASSGVAWFDSSEGVGNFSSAVSSTAATVATATQGIDSSTAMDASSSSGLESSTALTAASTVAASGEASGSTGAPATSLSTEPLLAFMSWRGNDTGDCGWSVSNPCLSLGQTMAQLYNAAPSTTGPVLLLIEELLVGEAGMPQSYGCEQTPEGAYVYLSLTIDTYSVTADGSLRFRNDTALLTIEGEMARVQAEHDSIFTENGGISNPPTTHEASTLARGNQLVVFDCQGLGRALYIYGPVNVRLNNLAFINGNASATQSQEGGAIFSIGGGVLLTNCSLRGNTALRSTGPSGLSSLWPSGAGWYADSPTFVYVENLYAVENIAEIGGVVLLEHFDQVAPLDPGRGRSVFVWIRNSFFNQNQATQGGAIYFLVDPSDAINPSSFDPREAIGITWTISSSVFQNHTLSTYPANWAGNQPDRIIPRTGPTIFVYTWSIRRTSFRIVACVFEENGFLPQTPRNTKLLGYGGALFLQSAGSWVDSIISVEQSVFNKNIAGFGGALALQMNAQTNLTILIRSNLFNSNAAANNRHQSTGGAVQIQFGPRLDFSLDDCTVSPDKVGCELDSNFGSHPNHIRIDNNTWSGNNVEAGGGGLAFFVLSSYVLPAKTSSGSVPAQFVLPDMEHFPGNRTWQEYESDVLEIAGDLFVNNTVRPFYSDQAGVGGAMVLNLAQDFTIPLVYEDTATEEIQWQAFGYTVVVRVTDTRFIGNMAPCSVCSGGAIYQRNGEVIISNATFESNFAGAFGGALALDRDSSAVELRDCSFTQNMATLRGQALHVLGVGSIKLDATSMNFDSSSYPSASHIEIPLGGNFSVVGGSVLRCGEGYSFVNTSIASFRTSSSTQFLGQLVSSRSVTCAPCPANTFSFQFGYAIDDELDLTKSQLQCEPCPFGGDCSEGRNEVRALQNSWGIQRPVNDQSSHGATVNLSTSSPASSRSIITFYRCPEGTCCPFGMKCSYAYCAGDRVGILCSQCPAGMTPVLGSAQCRETDDCNHARWFWVMAVVASGIFSLYLLLSPRSRVTGGSSIDQFVSSTAILPWSSMLKVLIYFFQQASALQSASASGGSLAVSFRWITSLVNFRIAQFDDGQKGRDSEEATLVDPSTDTTGSATNRGICLAKDMSTVGVLAVNFLLPTLVAFWFVFVIALHRILVLTVPRYRDWMRSKTAKFVLHRDIKEAGKDQEDASVQPSPSVLTTHAVVVNAVELVEIQASKSQAIHDAVAMNEGPSDMGKEVLQSAAPRSDDGLVAGVISNVDTNSAGSCQVHPSALSCMLSSASVEYLLFTYASFLQTTATLLQCVDIDGELRLFQAASVKCYQSFQIALFFLLVLLSAVPIVLWKLPRLIRWYLSCQFSAPLSTASLAPICPHLLGAIRARYRPSVASYWESLLLLRRYLFVLFFTFVQDEFVRIFLLMLLVLISIYAHLSSKPFLHESVNHLESIALFCLGAIAAIQIRAASYATAQTVERGNTLKRTDDLNAVELSFLLMPLGVMLLLCAAHIWNKRQSTL